MSTQVERVRRYSNDIVLSFAQAVLSYLEDDSRSLRRRSVMMNETRAVLAALKRQ